MTGAPTRGVDLGTDVAALGCVALRENLAALLDELPPTLATRFSVDAILDGLVASIVDVLAVDGASVTLVPLAAPPSTAGNVDGPHVLSLPLGQDDVALGALHLHRSSGDPFDDATVAAARTLSDVAAAYLVVAQARVALDKNLIQELRTFAHEEHAALALQSSEERKSAILAAAIDAVITIDDRGRITEFNPAAEATFGCTEDDAKGSDLADLVLPPTVLGGQWIGLGTERAAEHDVLAHRFELMGTRCNGVTFPAEVTITPVRGLGPAFFIAFIRDLTQREADDADRRGLEARVHQTERLASLGELAGGVAHDFNNLLTVVLNHASFIAEDESNDSESRTYANEIVSASERGARMTRQLLQFARREPVHTEHLQLEAVVDGIRDLLDRAIGERVELVVGAHDELPPFVGDRGQTEQLLMNLAVNARDAMPDGGTLTIDMAVVEVLEARALRLTVSDTGTGMTREVAAHVFDPFFTTKRFGEGSGLGLSTVYGIVADAGGSIEVVSATGQGTSFIITVPEAPADTTSPDLSDHVGVGSSLDATPGDGRTILVVEDDDAVRAVTVAMLARNGYRVLETSDASGALVLAETETFELLLTDVVMPGLTGRELTERLRDRGRASHVLFMTGYSNDVFDDHHTLDPREAMIHKPFNEESLLSAVRAALADDTHPTTRVAV